MIYYILPLIGLATGALGTLIGAGGGFILMPVLLLMYPNMSVENVTAISMIVIFFNALSGTVAYVKMKRVDFFTGGIFAAATIPGSILGTFATHILNRSFFNPFFGIIMILLSSMLVFFKKADSSDVDLKKGGVYKTCIIKDNKGNVFKYTYNILLGIAISIGTGFLSPILGIGGGIIHVPAMIKILCFPAHIATATSHFTLMIMSFVSVITHISAKPPSFVSVYAALLSLGALPGAQIGAVLSTKTKDTNIIYILAAALAIAGIRIIFLNR